MLPAPAIALPVTVSSQVGEARRLFTRLAAQIGLPEPHCARVGLIVTELGTNLCKHAKNGELLARSLNRRRHYRNLPVLHRSWLALTVTLSPGPAPARGAELGVIVAPIPGETECGDTCCVVASGTKQCFGMIDGLGHGPQAAEAADEAVRIARSAPGLAPAELMVQLHEALRKTRGAAIALVTIEPLAGLLTYCSVGNTATLLVHAGSARMLPSSNGIVSHMLPRLETISLPWTGRDLLVMHSDGVHTRDPVYEQPGLLVRPAPVIAGMIYSRQKRGRDDAAVLVARLERP